jgi:hypothetical protein
LNGIQKVRGSIPLISTILTKPVTADKTRCLLASFMILSAQKYTLLHTKTHFLFSKNLVNKKPPKEDYSLSGHFLS